MSDFRKTSYFVIFYFGAFEEIKTYQVHCRCVQSFVLVNLTFAHEIEGKRLIVFV